LDLKYPREIRENLRYRAWVLEECERDPNFQASVRRACELDPIYYINCFCWTKDPRVKPDVLPFILYDFQEKSVYALIDSIERGEDLLVEKSRDMGVSWFILMVFEWFWNFQPGSDFRVGSRKEEYVDKLGDIDTLIEKIRFDLKRKPLFLLPKGFRPDEHATFMKIINPESGNSIVGESANPSFGSGGRRRAILLDEFSKWDNSVAGAAWTSTADVTPCRIPVSTPLGSANKFGQLANGTHEKIKKLTLHWTLHPKKIREAYYIKDGEKIGLADSTSAYNHWLRSGREAGLVRSTWYDAEALRRKEADLAQEVDIDYLRSGKPFFSQKALANQKVWPIIKRKLPSDSVPHGFHILAKLVEIDNRVEVREDAYRGWLRIYEFPRKGLQYVVGGDVAEGLAKGDESFLVVREKWTRNVVATSNGAYPPDDLAIKAQRVGKFYNKEIVAVENNNHGYSVNSDLCGMDCKLYYTKNKKNDVVKAGWSTTPLTRPRMLDQLEEEIRKGVIELRDETLISQCKTFVFNAKNGKPEADGDFLDDGVIATAIAGIVIVEFPYVPFKDEEEPVQDMKKPMFTYK